jgi:D-aminoacyl-tRNA deacylase
MKLIIQYVNQASVTVDGQVVNKIGRGYMVLVGIGKSDTITTITAMSQKLLKLRCIPDDHHKLNLSITDIGGEMLLISQFTLLADTSAGNRPSYSSAAPAAHAKPLFNNFVNHLQTSGLPIKTGHFGAHMNVSLTNSGPITIILET